MPLHKWAQLPLVPDLTCTRKQTSSTARAATCGSWRGGSSGCEAVKPCPETNSQADGDLCWCCLGRGVLPVWWESLSPQESPGSLPLPTSRGSYVLGVLCPWIFHRREPYFIEWVGFQVQMKHKLKTAFSQNYPEKTPLSNAVVSSAMLLARINTSG